MNLSKMVGHEIAVESAAGLSKTKSRLSLLTAVGASQAYSIHAVFFAHALTPISVFVIDRQTHLHLLSGQSGSIQEAFHWDGLIPTILISVLVFLVGWIAARGTAKRLTSSGPRESTFHPNPSISTSSSYRGDFRLQSARHPQCSTNR